MKLLQLFPAVLGLALLPTLAQADVLDTPSFTITIVSKCAEGEVTCNNVSYVGTSKKSSQTITLTGSTLHTGSKSNPGRFLGYRFKNKDVVYDVTEDGLLRVTRGKQVLVEEQGQWKN